MDTRTDSGEYYPGGDRRGGDPIDLTFDDAVTRTSARAVKGSGIWAAIWGALAALPSGFASLYDWCVAQLAKYLPLAGGTVTGELAIGPNSNYSARFESDAGGAVSLLLRDTNGSMLYISGNKLIYQQFNWQLGVELYFPSSDGILALAAPNPTAGNLAALDANGNPTDSGTKPSDFAYADDLRYLILGAIYNARDDFYILADRTVNLITANDETSIDIKLPAAVMVGAVRYARDFFLDIENSQNASDLALEFTGLGVDYAFVPLEDESISEMMTIGAGERVRLYFTETPYTATGSLPVINVAHVTLGDFVTSTTTQGGN